MAFEPDKDLELWADRQLKALPDQPAPAELIGRVMRALESRQRLSPSPRSWLEWPRLWQFVSAFTFVVLAGTAGFWIRALATGDWLQTIQQSVPGLSALAGAVGVLLRTPLAWGVIGLFLFLYLFCFGVGAACFQLARTDASEPQRS